MLTLPLAIVDTGLVWTEIAYLQYIRDIQMPLTKIPVASVTVIALVWFWSDFLGPFVYLDITDTNLLVLIQN